jgi:hypothetical protein
MVKNDLKKMAVRGWREVSRDRNTPKLYNQLLMFKDITVLTVTTAAKKLNARVNCSGF